VEEDGTQSSVTPDIISGATARVGDARTVSTKYGEREVADVSVETQDSELEVSLWGNWAETVEYLEKGMELAVENSKRNEYDGETTYSTGEGSRVVVEPSRLVNATDVREWVQCPRIRYLSGLRGVPLKYEVVRGTVVHGVFEDLINGKGSETAVNERVSEAGLELGLLGKDADEVADEVTEHSRGIEGWLSQTSFDDEDGFGRDDWRTEKTLFDTSLGMKGRADALNDGSPVELKTGKCDGDARFQDKIQVACYALMLDSEPDTGVVLYTGNAVGGDSPAFEFRLSDGLLDFALRKRNEIAAFEASRLVPTGHEANANCSMCFEKDPCMVVAGRLEQESKAGAIGEPLPDEQREYFGEQYAVVEKERDAVHEESARLSEDEDEGALDGLETTSAERLGDGGWRLVLRKPPEATSRVTEGDLVLLSQGDPSEDAETAWVLDHTAEEVFVRVGERIEATRLDPYPSDVTLDRYLVALHDFVLTGDDRKKSVLIGDAEPEFEDIEGAFVDNNESQDRAIRRALGARDFSLIQGPPGTGKTYTVARLVRELVERDDRVLLSAFTNRAVDNALEALLDQGFNDFVRMGTRDGVRADMLEHRLETSGDPTERAHALEDASVVACTTATCASRVMREQEFDYAVVDEASQLTEPATLAATNLAVAFTLVGDHEQLPPVSASDAPSMFERLAEGHPEAAVTLDRQYRMAQRIQAFPSREFYDGELLPANGEVAQRSLDEIADPPGGFKDTVTFVPVEGAQKGNANEDEARRVEQIIEGFLGLGADEDDIAVIAPFRAQVAEIGRRVPEGIAVDTVDRFQGSSEEVVLVSFVATGSLDSPIFEDPRRLNVALTRAKRSLILIGDPAALETDPFYSRLLDWATR